MRFLTIERDDPNSLEIAQNVIQKCESIGWIYTEANPEIILSVGGDGTLLRGIHDYIDKLDSLYFVGIHTGTLGFYTDYTQNELEQLIVDIQKNEMKSEKMPLLEIYLPETGEMLRAHKSSLQGNSCLFVSITHKISTLLVPFMVLF